MQHPLILTGVYKGVTMGKNLKAYDEVCDCMGIFDDLTGTIGMVDDDRRSLDSLERLVLEMTPGLRIAWSVIDGPRAVSLTLDARTRPDLVLVDLSMESMSGVMVCRRIRRRDSMVKLLAMTSFAKETFGFDVAQAGAQVLYEEVRARVPMSAKPHKSGKKVYTPGNLRRAIYQAYAQDESSAEAS